MCAPFAHFRRIPLKKTWFQLASPAVGKPGREARSGRRAYPLFKTPEAPFSVQVLQSDKIRGICMVTNIGRLTIWSIIAVAAIVAVALILANR